MITSIKRTDTFGKLFKNKNEIKEHKIFIFGAPHAGKSTIIASLVNFINNDDELVLRRDPINNADGVSQIREWLANLHDGNFPLQTPTDTLTKVNIEFSNFNSNTLERIVVYEVSGEQVVKFDPTHPEHEDILELDLAKFLESSNKVLIVASNQPDSVDESNIAQDFLEFVDRTYPGKPVGFALTKYDLISEKYVTLTSSGIVQATRDIYPSLAKLLYVKDKTEVFPFSVGAVENNRIICTKYKMCSKLIFDWIRSEV